MLIMHNKSKSWFSDEPWDDTEYAGILTDVSPIAPPGLDDPNASGVLMRYDVVLIDADYLDEKNPQLLKSKKIFWDGFEWIIDGALAWYHNDEQLYRFWISRVRERESPRLLQILS